MKKNHLLSNTIRVCLSLLSLLIYSSGCAMASNLYPLPESDVRVIGDKIYHDDKLFAELRYFTDKQYNIYKGVVIYYYQYNKEVWVFPKEGWSARLGSKEYFTIQDLDMIWNKYLIEHQKWVAGKRGIPKLDEVVILSLGGKNPPKLQPTVFDVKISSDGKYVYYKTPGAFFSSSHKYLVEYGISK